VTLEQSIRHESAAIWAKLGANQAALIALLMPQHQGMYLPAALPMPATTTLLPIPADLALVELPPLAMLANGPEVSSGKVPLPTVPPVAGGLFFSSLSIL
jgi:hypothetical protein